MFAQGGKCLVVLALLLQACSASIDVDKARLKTQPVGCLKGTKLVCPCSDGTTSHQTCNDLGRYEPCLCGQASESSAGAGG
jgi:hypothetical protein